jgi:hypothetical protein
VLEGEELAAVPQGVPGQEPQLREAVEDDVLRLQAFDLGEDLPGRLAELDLRGVEDDVGGFAAGVELRAGEVDDLDGVQGPAVRAAGPLEVLPRLGEGDVEAGLPSRLFVIRYWRASVVLPEPGPPCRR